MRVQQIISDYFSTQPVAKAWLFGSYSRGEATAHSDVDIMVSFLPNSNVTLLNYTHIVNDLQRLLRKKVDLTEEGQLLPFAQDSAERDKILIYERNAKG